MMVDRQHVQRRVVVDVQPVVFDPAGNGVVVFRQLAVRVLPRGDVFEQLPRKLRHEMIATIGEPGAVATTTFA